MSCPSCIIALSGVDGFSASEIPTDPKCIAIALLAMVAGGYAGHKLVKGSPKAGMVGGGAAGLVLGALLGGCHLKTLSQVSVEPTQASTGPIAPVAPPIGRPGTPAPGGRPGDLTMPSSSTIDSSGQTTTISAQTMLPQGQSTQQGGVFAKLAQAFKPILPVDFQSQCAAACSQKYVPNSGGWNACAEVCGGATVPSATPPALPAPIKRTAAAAQSGLTRLGAAIQRTFTPPSAKSKPVSRIPSPKPGTDMTISPASPSTMSPGSEATVPSSDGMIKLSAFSRIGSAMKTMVGQQAATQQASSVFR